MKSDGTHPNTTASAPWPTSSSTSIAAITVQTDRVVAPFIDGGSNWKYSDQGLDLGTNWAQPQYDDSAWAERPAGLQHPSASAPTVSSAPSQPTSTSPPISAAPCRARQCALRTSTCGSTGQTAASSDFDEQEISAQPARWADRIPGPGDHRHGRRRHVHLFRPAFPIASLPAGTSVRGGGSCRVSLRRTPASSWFDLGAVWNRGVSASGLARAMGRIFTVRWPATNNAGFILRIRFDLFQSAAWISTWAARAYAQRRLRCSGAAGFSRGQPTSPASRRACLRPRTWAVSWGPMPRPSPGQHRLRRLQPRDLRPACRPLASGRPSPDPGSATGYFGL